MIKFKVDQKYDPCVTIHFYSEETMAIINNSVENPKSLYPIDTLAPQKDILFIDIETTGFSAKTSKLYLIGCMFWDNGYKTKQFFAEEYSDEKTLLEDFFDFAITYKVLIHFNGNNFDIPYLLQKCREFSLDYSFDKFIGIDIYKRISPYKNFLKLENCKQKTLEAFLKIDREDKFSGGDLIGIYHEFVKTKDEDLKKFLLLHNYEDLTGMLGLLPILAYQDLFTHELKVTKVSANYYTDESGQSRNEIMMIVDLPSSLLTPVSFLYDKCYFSGAGNQGMIKVPLYEEEMKYFYANHSDYYYLPNEDIALHKSVAAYVDKNFRVQAKANNCYTRKTAKFLPEWDALITPFFKRSYEDKDLFFELTDERRTDREMFNDYASHVLNHMVI